MLSIIGLLLAIIVYLVYNYRDSKCLDEVQRLERRIKEIQQSDLDLRSLSTDLRQKKREIDSLKIELAKARQQNNDSHSAEILRLIDKIISDVKKIDAKMQDKLKDVKNIDGLESLRTTCELIEQMVEDDRVELEANYNELVRLNNEKEELNQEIANLRLENARLITDLNANQSENARMRQEIDGLRTQLADTKTQLAVRDNELAIANDKISQLESAVSDLDAKLGAAKSGVPIAFEVNMRKFVSREDKSFKIPVVIKENYALSLSGEKRNCIVYLRVGRQIVGKNKTVLTKYLDSNNKIIYDGKEKSYNGAYSFEWGGEELQFDIEVSSIEKKKVKLTRENFVYDYFIFMDGKENSFREDCFPSKK